MAVLSAPSSCALHGEGMFLPSRREDLFNGAKLTEDIGKKPIKVICNFSLILVPTFSFNFAPIDRYEGACKLRGYMLDVPATLS